MPMGKIYKKGKKRRMIKRKRKPSLAIPYSVLGGFPDSVKVRLRYVEEVRLNPSAGNINQISFRCNSAYDPNFSGLGHQPLYWDQWSKIYTKYTVMGSKCIFQWTPGGTTNTPNGYMGIYLSTSSDGVSQVGGDLETLLESNNSTRMRLAGVQDYSKSAPSNSSKAVMKFSARKFFGIKDPTDGNVYSGNTGDLLTGSNPSSEAFFSCYYAPIQTNEPESQTFLVTIEYLIEFRDRKPVLGS